MSNKIIMNINNRNVSISKQDILAYYAHNNPRAGVSIFCGIVGDNRLMHSIVEDATAMLNEV